VQTESEIKAKHLFLFIIWNK